MNPREGSITGLHYKTGQPVLVRWAEGLLRSVEPVAEAEEAGVWLAPALVDLQVNGYAGVDFQQDDLDTPALERAALALAADGCPRFLPTLITDEWTRLVARLTGLRRLRAGSAVLRHAIAGWHIEGPFLSGEAGFAGAHDRRHMQDPEPECLEALAEAAGSLPLLLTLAPERNGAVEMIRRARSLGFVVSLGHTNATPAQLAAALDAGATGFTHLGNGCPPTLDRGDNILWRVLDAPPPWVSLIPDGHHVSPPLFRLLHRVLGPDRVLYVTDAMAAAAAAWPGRYRLGSLELEASAEGVVRLPGGSQFAGSALSPIEGIRRAAGMRRCSWQEVWDAGSLGPARAMGLPHGLGAGAPADGCVIRTSASNEILSVYSMTGSPRQAEPGPGT